MMANKILQRIKSIYCSTHILFLIMTIVILFSGCVYSPWEKALYSNEELENVRLIDAIPDKDAYSEYYVNNAFVIIGIRSINAGNYVSSPPYKLLLRVNGQEDVHEFVIINGINISSNLNGEYNKDVNVFFPIKREFTPLSYTNQKTPVKLAKVSFAFDTEPLFFKPKEGEQVSIDLDVTVVSKEKKETKTIKFLFTPKIKKGLFKWISI